MNTLNKEAIRRSTGFTIVELLIVIVVIAILAAITIVAYRGIQTRAVDTSNDSNITNLLKMAETHKAAYGSYPDLTLDTVGDANITRWGTDIATASDAIYRNPNLASWAGTSSLVVNIPVGVNDSTPKPYQLAQSGGGYPVYIPNSVPAPYADWDEFYDDARNTLIDWFNSHDYGDDTTPAEEDALIAEFVGQYPQFACRISDDADCEGTEKEVLWKWMYFIDPLTTAQPSSSYPCWNISAHRNSLVTGYKIHYYNEAKSTWVTKQTGTGEPNFKLCAM